MESKADVKAIMARFQASEATSEASATLPGRAKPSLQPTLSSGPTVPSKKPVMEALSSGAVALPPKPVLKSTESHEANKPKPRASTFSSANVGSGDKPVQKIPQKPFVAHPPDAKAPALKPSATKPPLSSTQSDSKPAVPKPAVLNRPSWVKDNQGGGEAPPKVPTPLQKPISSISKLRQQSESSDSPAAATKLLLPNLAPKPMSTFKETQGVFNREAGGAEQPDGSGKAPLAPAASAPPPKPPASKKPSLKKPSPQVSSFNGDASGGPKKNPLVNIFALGPAPAKPNRPPQVNLEPFRRGAEAFSDGPGTFSKPAVPGHLTAYPGNHSNHSNPSQPPPPPALPSLPPRHPGSIIQQEDFYDDIDELISPPPLPPTAGHPSQRAKVKEKSDDQDEDPDQWEKRQETEKKEREKKEQDARKKFKLVGPLEAIHQVKARLDYRGSKMDLALKQGEDLDIIRVQGNPEGKWLGRNHSGSIGYVKIASVEIDFNSLKRCKVQPTHEPEVYDDIDTSAIRGHGVVLPPLPGEDGEIYDDVIDPSLEVSDADAGVSPVKPRSFLRMFEWSRRTLIDKAVPPPSQFTTDGNADQSAAADMEEIYDDVDSQALPPPPPPSSSIPGLKFMNKAAEIDPKKQKKMEKEEKEFRKKFKYEGEIRVLYQVNVVPILTNKKWASKDLAVKAGERLDVIAKATNDRLICRSEEGKLGYVSTSHIIMDDNEIYDDIGDDCIYDND